MSGYSHCRTFVDPGLVAPGLENLQCFHRGLQGPATCTAADRISRDQAGPCCSAGFNLSTRFREPVADDISAARYVFLVNSTQLRNVGFAECLDL